MRPALGDERKAGRRLDMTARRTDEPGDERLFARAVDAQMRLRLGERHRLRQGRRYEDGFHWLSLVNGEWRMEAVTRHSLLRIGKLQKLDRLEILHSAA